MKRRITVLLTVLTVLTLTTLLPISAVFAQETTLIESGKTHWQYTVTDTEGFEDMDRGWYLPDFDASRWHTGVTPFGDTESFSGWRGDNHGIYLITTFTLSVIPENSSLDLLMHYDNTAKIYLNGSLIFQDTGWNDTMEHFTFSTEFLKEGKNTLAVSILDDVGGRGFDMTATLVPKSDSEIDPPEGPPTDPDETYYVTASKTEWEYTVTTTEGFAAMDANWMKADYDRSAWKRGAGPFGTNISGKNADRTGWKDDNHGIFLVTSFEIPDLEAAKDRYFYLDIYYDNTLTVYLNGVRLLYREGWNTTYEEIGISLSSALKEGENTLAVSLLDDVGGREFDMSLVMTSEVYRDPLTVTAEQLAEAGLPILRIDTDNGDYVRSRVEYVSATMVFENLGAYPDEDNIYTEAGGAPIEIRGRGNSTWNNGYPDGKQNTLAGDTHTRKVPYNIKLDEKVNLFGMGKSKKWVLLASYMDRTNLRNKLIFDLSGRMGMNYTESVFVNLVLNGEYMGVYALCEKVDVDLFGGEVTDFEDYAEDFAKAVAKKEGYDKAWRADFEELLCEDLSWLTEPTFEGYTVAEFVDLSDVSTKTGYLIEYDGYADEASFFQTDHGVPLKVSNLEGIKSNETVFNDLKSFFNDFEEALYSDNFYNSKGKHYSEYVNMDSFVDYFILNTLILNVEFGYKSMYMVLGSDGKLTLGPCWDYDWSSGNPFLGANGQYDQWYNDGRANNNKWYRQVYSDPWFTALVRERWATLGDAIDDMIASMDVWEDYLLPSTELEYAKFGADEYETDFHRRTGGRSFSDEVEQLRTFLKNRKAWLDVQFAKRDPNIEDLGFKANSALRLTLGGACITADHALFDYAAATATGDASLTVSCSGAKRATLYVNGIEQESTTLTDGFATAISVSLDTLDQGVNTLTVYAYSANGRLVGENYLSLVLPGEKQTAPTVGSFLPGEAPEPAPDPEPVPDPEPNPEPDPEPDPKPDPNPEPDPEPEPEPTVKRLGSDTLDAYTQATAVKNGKYSLRVVFVAEKSYLYTHTALTVTLRFTLRDGSVKLYEGALALDSEDYTLCRVIEAGDDVYIAEDGDLLFGNCITEIPENVLATLTVTVTDASGTVVYTGVSQYN